jgi:hypothetical protein
MRTLSTNEIDVVAGGFFPAGVGSALVATAITTAMFLIPLIAGNKFSIVFENNPGLRDYIRGITPTFLR